MLFAYPPWSEIMLLMITISIAFVFGIGVFAATWLVVSGSAIRLFGKDAEMTFTPVAYKPALQADGSLRFEARRLVTIPTGEFVPFEPRHERYMKIAEVGTALASASLIFVPSSRLNVYPHSCAFALVLLGFSVMCCIGFMVMLTYYYEAFLYEPRSYSPSRYGLVHALGFGGLITRLELFLRASTEARGAEWNAPECSTKKEHRFHLAGSRFCGELVSRLAMVSKGLRTPTAEEPTQFAGRLD